jgi:porphobilinogen synthase
MPWWSTPAPGGAGDRERSYHPRVTFPQRRLRRLRRTPALRRLVTENRLHPDDFVAPLFVREGIDDPRPIPSLPEQLQHTRESLRKEVHELVDLGLPAVILFGVPATKDPQGSGAWNREGIVQLAIRDLRDDHGDDLVIIGDLCLDEYTDHGHCGLLDERGEVDNDSTLELYQRIALAQAEAGVDVVGPSGMMDGQVAAIRAALEGAGHHHVSILAYAAKYATALYGPFRDAVDVTIAGGGNRKTYQQDVANGREAMEEIRADIAEGADMVMVKPAMPYLDVIAAARNEIDVPIAAYHVSGEYSMIHAAADRGWLDLDSVAHEHVLAVKRAGADIILTYFAKRLASALR